MKILGIATVMMVTGILLACIANEGFERWRRRLLRGRDIDTALTYCQHLFKPK
jgi:hypothetical protein